MLHNDAGRHHRYLGFARALYLTLSWGFVPTVWLYAVGFPTRDLRARLPFLLSGGAPLLLSVFAVLGVVAVALTEARVSQAWRAILGGAILSYLVLASGVVGRVLPADYDSPARPGFVLLSAAVALWLLWRERRYLRGGQREDMERAV